MTKAMGRFAPRIHNDVDARSPKSVARVHSYTRPLRRDLSAAIASARVAIESLSPSVDVGRFAVKRSVGQPLVVEADVFMDGHDQLGVHLLWRAADEQTWNRVPMQHLGNDRWGATFQANRIGLHEFTVEAGLDRFASYREDLRKKQEAGVDISLDAQEARQWLRGCLKRACNRLGRSRALQQEAQRTLEVLQSAAAAETLAYLSSPAAQSLMEGTVAWEFMVRLPAVPLRVERRAASFAHWYELFPRSQSGSVRRHGNFDDVIERLPAVREMGFDVLYFPPIHPIGMTNRKGRNNSLVAQADEPGSPYAIGSEEGGHDAIHPQLGTLEDFRRLIAVARHHDIEIALDFAVQCSPDHPWLRAHPQWFAWRADGSIRYAENPPKKYEDIVGVDFYARIAEGGDAARTLWLALLDVVLFWVKEGVRTFRVDNPHTKPLPFWEWLIAQVQERYPEVIFLSEAFTRPKMMYRLAKLGFTQSYTYFTWREHKQELSDYLNEISCPPVSDFFRPNFFVNTPDINPRFLQVSGRAGFLIRAALASTMSAVWGMYSGFELCEASAVPGKEEYLDSEKYEIRAWDWRRPGNIVAEVTVLNRVRRENPAFHRQEGIRFHRADNDQILMYTRATPERDNVVLIVVSLDPFAEQGANMELPLWEFGLADDGVLQVEDLLHGYRFEWQGKNQHISLSPEHPYSIWRLSSRP